MTTIQQKSRFFVSIDFKKGPAFSTEIEAADKKQAEAQAKADAKIFGFDYAVRKVLVVLV